MIIQGFKSYSNNWAIQYILFKLKERKIDYLPYKAVTSLVLS